MKTCPLCRHAWHDNDGCLNMASDNDCACKGVKPSLGVLQERYPEVEPFTRRMLDELWNNRSKGDQLAWRAMSLREAWGEISWHNAKLAVAIKNRNADQVRELAADVANMAMMLVDILDQMEAPTDA